MQYNPDNKILIVEYRLPSPRDLPRVKEIRYLPARDEMRMIELSESDINKLFDAVAYQVCLRTVHEIFEADVIEAVDAVVFNGWVDYIDDSTGHET